MYATDVEISEEMAKDDEESEALNDEQNIDDL